MRDRSRREPAKFKSPPHPGSAGDLGVAGKATGDLGPLNSVQGQTMGRLAQGGGWASALAEPQLTSGSTAEHGAGAWVDEGLALGLGRATLGSPRRASFGSAGPKLPTHGEKRSTGSSAATGVTNAARRTQTRHAVRRSGLPIAHTPARHFQDESASVARAQAYPSLVSGARNGSDLTFQAFASLLQPERPELAEERPLRAGWAWAVT